MLASAGVLAGQEPGGAGGGRTLCSARAVQWPVVGQEDHATFIQLRPALRYLPCVVSRSVPFLAGHSRGSIQGSLLTDAPLAMCVWGMGGDLCVFVQLCLLAAVVSFVVSDV